MTYTGRHRNLPRWRGEFKADWKACSHKEINLERMEEKYHPSVKRWVCGCPAFVISRFLICKHLIQACKPMPATFFQEVTRNRSGATWRHPSLVPLIPEPFEESEIKTSTHPQFAQANQNSSASPSLALVLRTLEDDSQENAGNGVSGGEEGSDDGEALSEDEGVLGAGEFSEQMENCRRSLLAALDILDYNTSLNDLRILPTLRHKFAGIHDLVQQITAKEEAVNSRRASNPTTWDPKTASIMFFRTRPTDRIRDHKRKYNL